MTIVIICAIAGAVITALFAAGCLIKKVIEINEHCSVADMFNNKER